MRAIQSMTNDAIATLDFREQDGAHDNAIREDVRGATSCGCSALITHASESAGILPVLCAIGI